MVRFIFISFIILNSFTACTPKKLSYEEFKSFIADEANGVAFTEEVKGIEVKVNYYPTEMLIAQELEGENYTKSTVDSLQKKYDKAHYFILTLAKEGKEVLNPRENFSQYSELLQVLSFRLGEFVSLTTASGKVINVSDYAFQRDFGMSASNKLLFSFQKEKGDTGNWLQFNVKEFGLGTGNLQFKFQEDQLRNLPQLDYKIN